MFAKKIQAKIKNGLERIVTIVNGGIGIQNIFNR